MNPDRPRLRSTRTASGLPEAAVLHEPAQDVVAALLRDPRQAIVPLIQAVSPGDVSSQAYRSQLTELRRAVLSLMKRIAGADFRGASQQDPSFADRMTVCWQLLFACDQVVKKLKPQEVPTRPGVAWLSAALAPTLGAPLGQPLVASLMDRLRLGADGEFLKHYCAFFKMLQVKALQRGRSKPPAKASTLPPPLSGKSLTEDGLRRVAWWLIRARRERYVEFLPAPEPPYLHVHFGHVVREVHRELVGLCGGESIGGVDSRGIAEQEVNAWLRYGGLDIGEPGATNDADQSPDGVRDLVRAFSESNRLTQRLVVAAEERAPAADPELEAQLRQYATENRALEERIRALEAQLMASSEPPTASQAPHSASLLEAGSELRELVRLIDAKYSLDVLKSIQLGTESPLTLRSFVSHLLFALTKKGLVAYPTEDRFELSYEKSGLYECEGFEVKPGETLSVTVVRRGWALQAKDRLLPVRRARVEREFIGGQGQ